MSLPLKAKVAVRDLWAKSDAPAQKAISSLHESLGLEVACEPDWSILCAELDSVYDDKGQLVRAVISCIQVWCETVSEMLEDEKYEDWGEKLIDKLRESYSRLTLIVEVSKDAGASTLWSDTRKGFFLTVPNVQFHQAAQFGSIFQDELSECFDEKKQAKKSIPIHSTTGDEWADVGADIAVEQPAVSSTSRSAAPAVDFLPDPNSLPKPGTLLLKPPYHMFISTLGANKMEIQCSHAPTLNVLAEYLKRWCKTNPNLTNKPPCVNVELNLPNCSFGLYDTLTLVAPSLYGSLFTVSPTLILNLVEGVLGYERVYGDAHSWHYRRDTPYKN